MCPVPGTGVTGADHTDRAPASIELAFSLARQKINRETNVILDINKRYEKNKVMW